MQYRQMPDGTWFNEQTGVLTAPAEQTPGQFADMPAPVPGLSMQQQSQALMVRPGADPLGNYGAAPLLTGARHGRNYPALGQVTVARKLVMVGSLIGLAVLTVWLQNRGKKSKG